MKLFNVTKSDISEEFYAIMLEGNKADWIAMNQGEKLIKKGKEYGDHMMAGKTAQEVGDYLEQEGGKFAPYMAQLYLRGDVTKMEDMYQINQLIKKFNKVSMHLDNKDITRYSLPELRSTLNQFEGKLTTNHANPVKDKEMEEGGHMTKLIDTPNFEAIVSHSKEASRYLGKDTAVCTANTDDEHNYHDHYANDGLLYTIRAGKRRFLLHYESDQLKDEDNETISKADIKYLSQFDEWADFLNMLIKKYYYSGKHVEKALGKRQKEKGSTPVDNSHLPPKDINEHVVSISKNELREVAKSPQRSYEYARDVIGGRFKLGEAAIKTSSKYSILYARNVLKESYDEASIAKDAKKSYFYAKNVLEGRFQLGEAAIRANPEYAQLYVKNILKS